MKVLEMEVLDLEFAFEAVHEPTAELVVVH